MQRPECREPRPTNQFRRLWNETSRGDQNPKDSGPVQSAESRELSWCRDVGQRRTDAAILHFPRRPRKRWRKTPAELRMRALALQAWLDDVAAEVPWPQHLRAMIDRARDDLTLILASTEDETAVLLDARGRRPAVLRGVARVASEALVRRRYPSSSSSASACYIYFTERGGSPPKPPSCSGLHPPHPGIEPCNSSCSE